MKIRDLDSKSIARFLELLYGIESCFDNAIKTLCSTEIDDEEEEEEDDFGGFSLEDFGLDETSLAIDDIRDDINRILKYNAEMTKYLGKCDAESGVNNLANLQLFITTDLIILNEKILTASSVSEDDLEYYQAQFLKNYKIMADFIPRVLDATSLYEDKAAGRRLPYEVELFENNTGLDAVKYCIKLQQFTKEHPLDDVEEALDNIGMIMSKVPSTDGITEQDLIDHARMIMPYDITAIKRGELVPDTNYYARLMKRSDDPASVCNDRAAMFEMAKMIDDEDAYAVYVNEDNFGEKDIADILRGKRTIKELLEILANNTDATNLF